MTRDFWIVFQYELRRNLRRSGYLFTTFGIPLLAVVGLFLYQQIAGTQAQNAPDPTAEVTDDLGFEGLRSAGYVDLANITTPETGDPSGILTRYDDEAAALAAITNGDIQLYYLIEPDYLATGNVIAVQPRVVLGELNFQPISQLLFSVVTKDLDPELRARLANPSLLSLTNLQLTSVATTADADADAGEGSAFVLVYVFGLALTFSLFVTNGYLMQSVIEEKETRLVEILLSSLRPRDLLSGKIIALGILGLLQVAAWVVGLVAAVQVAAGSEFVQTLGILATLANIQIPFNILPVLLVYFVLAYLMFAGFYSIVSALSNSMREGPQYAVLFTLPAVLPFYFISVFTSEPNGTLATVMSIFPLTAPMAMTMRLVLTDVPVADLVISVALLAVSVVGVMWLAGRIFRVAILLSGSMPKLRDIPRLIRS